eukprot:4057372-Alexandrium_andersonii.AAC.1
MSLQRQLCLRGSAHRARGARWGGGRRVFERRIIFGRLMSSDAMASGILLARGRRAFRPRTLAQG